MMLLAKVTHNGINITDILFIYPYNYLYVLVSYDTVKSFVELVYYIFKIPGVNFFLSEHLPQDPLKNFFGCQ